MSQAEVKRLLALPDETTAAGQRDRIALGLMVAALPGREEAVNLVFGDIKLQPIRGKFRTVLETQGKGDKTRLVPIRDTLAAALEDWNRTTGPGRFGRILRSVDQTGVIGNDLTGVGLFNIVRGYGREMSKLSLAPTTCAGRMRREIMKAASPLRRLASYWATAVSPQPSGI